MTNYSALRNKPKPIDVLDHATVQKLQKPLVKFLDNIEPSKALTEIAKGTRQFQRLKYRVAYLKQPFTSELALPDGIIGLPRHTAYVVLSIIQQSKARYALSLGQLRPRETLKDRGEGFVRGMFMDTVTASLLRPHEVEHLLYGLLAGAKHKKRNAPEIRARELAQVTLARHAEEIIYQPWSLTDKRGLKFQPFVDCYNHEYFKRKGEPPVDNRF